MLLFETPNQQVLTQKPSKGGNWKLASLLLASFILGYLASSAVSPIAPATIGHKLSEETSNDATKLAIKILLKIDSLGLLMDKPSSAPEPDHAKLWEFYKKYDVAESEYSPFYKYLNPEKYEVFRAYTKHEFSGMGATRKFSRFGKNSGTCEESPNGGEPSCTVNANQLIKWLTDMCLNYGKTSINVGTFRPN